MTNTPPTRLIGVVGATNPYWITTLVNHINQHALQQGNDSALRIITYSTAVEETSTKSAISKEVFRRGVETLMRAKADNILIADSGAHKWIVDLDSEVEIPIVHMIDEAIRYIMNWHIQVNKAGVLDVDGSLNAGLYQSRLKKQFIEPICLATEDQMAFMTLLEKIRTDPLKKEYSDEMKQLAETLTDRGAEVLIIGCPEAAEALKSCTLSVFTIDATEVLARRAVTIDPPR